MAVVVLAAAIVDRRALHTLLTGAGWRLHRGECPSGTADSGPACSLDGASTSSKPVRHRRAAVFTVDLERDARALPRLVTRQKRRGFKVVLVLPPPVDESGRRLLLQAFEAGADDFVTTVAIDPELPLRLEALLSRCHAGELPQGLFGIEFDRRRRRLRHGERIVSLTPCESRVLACLARRPGRVISRSCIQRHLTPVSRSTSENLVDVYILYLRRKLHDLDSPCAIRTIRGAGYALVRGQRLDARPWPRPACDGQLDAVGV